MACVISEDGEEENQVIIVSEDRQFREEGKHLHQYSQTRPRGCAAYEEGQRIAVPLGGGRSSQVTRKRKV